MSRKRKLYTHVVDTGILSPCYLNENKFVVYRDGEYRVTCMNRIISEDDGVYDGDVHLRHEVLNAINLTSQSVHVSEFKYIPFCAYMHLGTCIYHNIIVTKRKKFILAEDVSPYVWQ